MHLLGLRMFMCTQPSSHSSETCPSPHACVRRMIHLFLSVIIFPSKHATKPSPNRYQHLYSMRGTEANHHHPHSQWKRGRSFIRCSALSGSCGPLNRAWCLCFGRQFWAKTDYDRRAVSSEEMLYGRIIAWSRNSCQDAALTNLWQCA